jgi:mannose-6-phosphate isomerase-like protein (cupin superfamily)
MLVVPRGCWHRLEAVQPGRLMFITPARGSEHEKVQP